MWLQCLQFVFLEILLKECANAASNTVRDSSPYNRSPYGRRRDLLNTPSNTNGKIGHRYIIESGTGNAPGPRPPSYPPSQSPSQPPKQSPAGTYPARDRTYSRPTSKTGYSVPAGDERRSSPGRGETGKYGVVLQGSPLPSSPPAANYPPFYVSWGDGGGPRDSSFASRWGRPLTSSLFPSSSQPASQPWAAGMAGEVVMAVMDRAMLEEGDADMTGQTHCLDTPRCSYVPVRQECRGHEKFRTADGTCNNLQRPLLGSSFQPFKRYLRPQYQDGVGSARSDSSEADSQGNPIPLPSARLVSRTVHLIKDLVSPITGLLGQFGQFVDHDVTGTTMTTGSSGAIPCCGDNAQTHEACLPITVPAGDTHFRDSTCINFVRSKPVTDAFNNTIEPRQQRNELTSYLDGSVIYGSTEDQTAELRTFQNGLLKSSEGDMLPLVEGGCVSSDGLCLTSGDTRVNEVPGLASLHVVFHRHHNRVARALASLLTSSLRHVGQAVDEAVFQTARRVVAAQLQHVVYSHWLPLVIGPYAVKHYGLDGGQYRYDPEVDPRVANVFATAAFRFGHSLVPDFVQFGAERVPLVQAFNNPSLVRRDVDAVLQGLLHMQAQSPDQFFVSGLRNRLFESSPRKGLDLAALNIQRGRDHGLPPYTAWRHSCGLPPVQSFNHSAFGTAGPSLREVYLSVDDVDVFTGAVSEPSVSGGVVGPTMACLIGRQFEDLAAGDRFFYRTTGPEGFTDDQLKTILSTTMADLLCSNTYTLNAVQKNPFLKVSPQNPLVPCSYLRQKPSVEVWREELTALIYRLSQRGR